MYDFLDSCLDAEEAGTSKRLILLVDKLQFIFFKQHSFQIT